MASFQSDDQIQSDHTSIASNTEHAPVNDRNDNNTANLPMTLRDEKRSDLNAALIGESEADLHKYLVGCRKNPGHTQFIPIDTFTMKHLPEGNQDDDLYELIKVTADLTVRVGVTIASPDRPEFWPETTQPYPFYNMMNRSNLRIGSGRVWRVSQYQDGLSTSGSTHWGYTKCWCRKCEASESPSNVWWEFDVEAAAHVVFDDIEASQTTLRLFYDRNDSPVVNLDKVRVYNVNIEHDTCPMKSVTCDQNVGRKLNELCLHCKDIWEKVWNKYSKSRDEQRLTFLVAHPHGCSKQVSVGRWKDKIQVDEDRYKFTYTTCTCPGSSGAAVFCLGYRGWWGLNQCLHSGSLKSKINYSGVSSDF
ncbi:uncharacterized protein LOC129928432 [Biomphalaria glabrata]|uniref:Uncharacterized protein LOC129928432 n=1 Tax=Biomphalaria glabrata TaxID=6526 RepID=A0A9W3BHA8_BIOGL|nr:uncharacterized protein LOC129928432 [Biomphalaria glabrata]